jgi:predicted transposase/invertase (TIGR01784 family)
MGRQIHEMFELDIRKTRVWQEAFEEGREEGRRDLREEGRREMREQVVQKLLAKGMPTKQIADLLDISVHEVRRLSRNGKHNRA